MATWSSFEKDRLLAENWRKFVKNNPEDKSSQTVFGINSEDNTESLLSFLKKNQGAIGLTPEQVNQLVALMLAQTKEDDVVLEAIGGPQRDARTFSSDTTTKLNALIKTFGLNDENERKLEKVLNRWAKLNTVSFEQGAPATPVVPEEEPDEDEQTPTEEPEQATSAAPVVPEEEPEKETPSRIDLLKPPRSLRDVKGSENYKKFMASLLDFFANQMKIDIKIAKKIVRDIWAKTPVSGKFNKLVFKEQMEKEIDIAAILANSGLNPTQQIKVLGALKKWAAQNSDLIDDRMTKILKLRDDEEQKPQPSSAETEVPTPDAPIEPEAEKPSQAPEVIQEPAPEPQATEEPLKIITKILGGKGVDEEKVNAFINDLRKMSIIQEMAPGALKRNLKMNKAEWEQFSQKHQEVIKAISQLGGNTKAARALRKQFKDALSKIITREKAPSVRRRRTIKKSTASRKEPTPAVATPAETEPEAASLEPEAPTPDTSAETDPEAPQPPSKSKKKRPPPVKNQEAYDHGKQGKSMNPRGTLIDRTVQNIDQAIKGLLSAKTRSDDEELRDKIDSYIRGLDEYEPPTKLEESLMLRWKTIAGIK
jgi:hypothetical protein